MGTERKFESTRARSGMVWGSPTDVVGQFDVSKALDGRRFLLFDVEMQREARVVDGARYQLQAYVSSGTPVQSAHVRHLRGRRNFFFAFFVCILSVGIESKIQLHCAMGEEWALKSTRRFAEI